MHVASNLCARLAQLGVQVLPQLTEEASILFTDNVTTFQSREAPTILLQPREQARLGSVVVNARCVALSEPIRRAKLIDALCTALSVTKPAILEEPRLVEFRKRRHRMGSPKLQRRILVVDDNLVNRKVTQQLLELLGYSRSCIYTASNGVEAIECLTQQVVDVVLMDLEMPVMDGMSATTEIRRVWGRHSKQVQIIACTAAATNEKRQQCLAISMDGFLTKPLKREALEDELES